MIAIKTNILILPDECDSCRWFGSRPHPYKGWTDICELMGECMDDDAPDEWIYDGNGRPRACPLIRIPTEQEGEEPEIKPISRQEAIEAFDFSFKVTGKENAEKVVEVLNLITERIKSLPSAQQEPDTALYTDGFNDGYKQGKKDAQPERKKGKWIKDELGTVVCSVCKRPRRDNRVSHINFCNSCGADMRGDSE